MNLVSAARLSPWLLAAYAALIALASLHPYGGWDAWTHWSPDFITAPLPRYITRTDLTTNFFVYAPLGYLLAVNLARPRQKGRSVFFASLAGLAFSLVLEGVQQLVPGRVASNLDVLLNSLGGLAGALLSLHHQRWQRTSQAVRRWRRAWFRPGPASNTGLWLLALAGLAQFALLPVPGAGWLDLHLRPFDTPPGGIDQLNLAWFAAIFLEMAALGSFAACLLKPGRYVGASLLLFGAVFTLKLLAAILLLKLRVVGGVLSLETLAAFLLAFWFLLIPQVSRRRHAAALLLLAIILGVRLALASYLVWPIASPFNLVGLAKAAASLWPWLALGVLLAMTLSERRRRWAGESLP
ncbi:MAG: VanZ family protein [Pseudomonadota bacterium]|nr:VanZ family protein [Pseudomonadota bacterium]